jgi:aryl-alcohol dehydrogenase-like predicted oxidoreductase
MEMRFLGNSGLQVSRLSFGLMTFGGTGAFRGVGSTQSGEAARLLDIAFEAGVNLLDTADIYSDGLSEQILGEIIGPRRQNFIIATKVYGKTGPGANDVGLCQPSSSPISCATREMVLIA